jgi:diguanylate cyclase (GGDEF)-like protein
MESNRTAVPLQTILLIEDNPDHARAIEVMSRGVDLFPFTLARADSLARALAILHNDQPQLILLDMHLPDGHGLPLLESVRAAAPQVPIVVLTALDDDRLSNEALLAGAQDYLVKGEFTIGELTRSLRHAVARQQLLADLEEARSREAQRATHDELTSLPNRLLFLDRLDHALDRCVRSSTRLAVVFIDLNGFKQVNDTHGHEAGDIILGEVARRLIANLRASDTVARLGGDEFTVLYEQIPDRTTAHALMNGLHDRFRQPILLDGREHQISISAGLAVYPEDGSDAAALLRCADGAMYAQKAGAKGIAVPRP